MFKNLSRVSFIFKRIFDCLLGFNFENKFFFFKPWRLSLRIDLNEKIKFRDIIGKPRVRSDFSNMLPSKHYINTKYFISQTTRI